ncbi:16S rRNA (uracil(1498)-N(3))-methyltransferase [Helicobacter sp. T3_23-1059]
MQFVFVESCGEKILTLDGEAFAHICYARRAKVGQTQSVRNLRDDRLYTYAIESITRKNATLTLESSQILPKIPPYFSHIIWAIISPQSIYKTLPSLNELGLSKLSLFFSCFSQGGAKIDTERIKRILVESCEQCGRSNLCEVEILGDLDLALERYKEASVLDFGGEKLHSSVQTRGILQNGIIIGAEGGFSNEEREVLKSQNRKIYGVESGLILRSTTATMAVLAKGL